MTNFDNLSHEEYLKEYDKIMKEVSREERIERKRYAEERHSMYISLSIFSITCIILLIIGFFLCLGDPCKLRFIGISFLIFIAIVLPIYGYISMHYPDLDSSYLF